MTKYQAVGIGNAVVDVISQCDDAFLARMGIDKGVMQLIETERAEFLYENMTDRWQAPGGSVANTIAGLGALGLSTGFIGRVSDDELGHYYAAAMAEVGTDFVNAPRGDGALPTSRSMIFVSPDGERSMNTYLGVSTELDEGDVPEAVAGKAGITLSDPFCVERHRADFRGLLRELDYVIGNEHEWCALYETEDLGAALEQAAQESGLIVCTRSGHDVVLVEGAETVTVPVHRVEPVDTTGAGDQFAAGLLYGLATGQPLHVAGRMGCIAAAEVIGHYGARPETDVKALFAAEGLI